MKYSHIRFALLTFAIGLAGVSFLNGLRRDDLPRTESGNLFVFPITQAEMDDLAPHIFCRGSLFIKKPFKKVNPHSPKTVRDYFMLLPERYFWIESLDRDKNLYLKHYLEVEDDENQYFEATGDGAQPWITMSLFKRSNGKVIIGIFITGEGFPSYFLEYRNKKWRNIEKEVVPFYKETNVYEFSRFEKTVQVSAWIEENGETRLTEIYQLFWKNDKFILKN